MTYGLRSSLSPRRHLPGRFAFAIVLAIYSFLSSAFAADPAVKSYDLPSDSADKALRQFSAQSGIQVIFPSESVKGVTTLAVKGEMTALQALDQMLEGTVLVGVQDPKTGALSVRRESSPEKAAKNVNRAIAQDSGRPSKNQSSDYATNAQGEQVLKLPEYVVKGSKSLNMDIRRTENDPQPYVVFDSSEIEASQATNLEDFFRKRLTMNTQQRSNAQGAQVASNVSQIDLRGLGVSQTLILVDGRRAPRVLDQVLTNGGDPSPTFTQADINGIPIAAIERVEVLASTAGGIYGGGAVGGVINIIRKRNYQGLDLHISTDGSLGGGGDSLRIELSGGFSAEHGKTQVSLSAAQTTSHPLYAMDNDLILRGRRAVAAADPTNQLLFLNTGATPHFQSATLQNLVLKPAYGGTPLNANFGFIPAGYRGILLDGPAALLANAGKFDFTLSNDSLGKYQRLLNTPQVRSANLNIRREFGSRIEGFADFTISENRGETMINGNASQFFLQPTAPENPFQQRIRVAIPTPEFDTPFISKSSVVTAAAGLIFKLRGEWTANLDYQWSRSTNNTSSTSNPLNAVGAAALKAGQLSVLRDLVAYPFDFSPYIRKGPNSFRSFATDQDVVSARASGPLYTLPAGAVSLTTLVEDRIERQPKTQTYGDFDTAILNNISPERSQEVHSGYAELSVPIFSEHNAVRMIQALEVQASLRNDQYATHISSPPFYTTPPASITYNTLHFNATDYTLAARWSPVKSVILRASYGTGFLPPSLNQLAVSNISLRTGSDGVTRDPRRNGEFVGTTQNWQVIQGGNINLKPESSKSLSAGLVIIPQGLPDLRFSVDYSQIRKRDEIGAVSNNDVLSNEDLFPSRVVRSAPSAADLAAGLTTGPVTSIDTTLVNIAAAEVEAVDYRADYLISMKNSGNIRLYAAATHETVLRRQFTPTSPGYNFVGFLNGPLAWRGNAGVEWNGVHWGVAWNVQYYDAYSVFYGGANQEAGNANNLLMQGGKEHVPNQMYHDLTVSYRFASSGNLLTRGLNLTLGVQNLFNQIPPAVLGSYSYYGDPRLQRFSLSLRKHF